MKRIFLLTILLCSMLPAGAQENVSFHVTDEYGYPIPDALITVVDFQKARTDAYGNAAVILPHSFHAISVSKPGYATYVTHFYVVGVHTLYVTLKKSRISILITVKDVYGRLLPSTLVSAGNRADLSQNFTDSAGMTLLWVPKGGYLITAQREGYEIAERRGVVEESTSLTLYMNNKGMGTITGIVLLRGSPVRFVDVEIVPENGVYSYRTKTDATGRFVVEVPKYGSYTIVIPKFGKVVKNVEPKSGLLESITVSIG